MCEASPSTGEVWVATVGRQVGRVPLAAAKCLRPELQGVGDCAQIVHTRALDGAALAPEEQIDEVPATLFLEQVTVDLVIVELLLRGADAMPIVAFVDRIHGASERHESVPVREIQLDQPRPVLRVVGVGAQHLFSIEAVVSRSKNGDLFLEDLRLPDHQVVGQEAGVVDDEVDHLGELGFSRVSPGLVIPVDIVGAVIGASDVPIRDLEARTHRIRALRISPVVLHDEILCQDFVDSGGDVLGDQSGGELEDELLNGARLLLVGRGASAQTENEQYEKGGEEGGAVRRFHF